MSAGTCRVCACRDDRACPGGCSWVDASHTLCSQCESAEILAKIAVRTMSQVASDVGGRLALISSAWTDLPDDAQLLFINAMRVVVEKIALSTQMDLDERTEVAVSQFDDILEFLHTEARGEIRVGESAPDMIRRLIQPHLPRVILIQ